MSNISKIFLTLIVIFLVAAAGAYYYYAFIRVTPAPPTPLERLTEGSSSFREGEEKLKDGEWEEAVRLFSLALPEAASTEEEAQIKFKLATSKYWAGDVAGGVVGLKEIAADTRYSALARAYAVEYMGIMFFTGNGAEVTKEVFKDGPYKGLYDPANIPLSYRKLFEYASSFYPLAMAEVRIADWYASQVLRLLPEGKTPTAETLEEVNSMKGIIREKLVNANRDIERIKVIPSVSVIVPPALERKAVVVGKLYRAGDTSFGDPDVLFKEALDAHLSRGVYYGYTLYNYAVFLATAFGDERKGDIQKVLANFYTTDEFRGTPVFAFFETEKDNMLNARPHLELLASLDPEFKKLLVGLGWTFKK